MNNSGKDGGALEAGERAVGSMVTTAAAAASRNARLCSVAKDGTGRKEGLQNKQNQSKQWHARRCGGRKERCNRRPAAAAGSPEAGAALAQ